MLRLVSLLALSSGCYMFEDDEPGLDTDCGDGIEETYESCDDGNTEDGDGCSSFCAVEKAVTVRWSFFPSVNGSAQEGACRPDATTVDLVATSAHEIVRSFPCDENRMGTIFASSAVQVFARLRATDGSVVAQSIPQLPIGNSSSAQFYEDAGYVQASWAFRDSQGNTVDCPAVAPSMLLSLTPQAGGKTITKTLSCTSFGAVYSPAIQEGTYTVKLTSFRGEQTATVIVRNNNRVTDLAFVGP